MITEQFIRKLGDHLFYKNDLYKHSLKKLSLNFSNTTQTESAKIRHDDLDYFLGTLRHSNIVLEELILNFGKNAKFTNKTLDSFSTFLVGNDILLNLKLDFIYQRKINGKGIEPLLNRLKSKMHIFQHLHLSFPEGPKISEKTIEKFKCFEESKSLRTFVLNFTRDHSDGKN